MLLRALGSLVVVCVFLTGTGRAQPPGGIGSGLFHNYGYPYGPRVAPPWNYYGIPTGGPYVTYPSPPGNSGKSSKSDGSDLVRYSIGPLDIMSNGLCIFGPRVPVYGPLPDVIDTKQLMRQYRTMNKPALAGYGFHGLYNALPRPRFVTVSTWPVGGSQDAPLPAPVAPVPADPSGGSLTISVKVPQAAAEVFVDGKPTTQTGTDRTFESPPLEAGTRYKYTVTVRWLEGGHVVEKSKEAIGARGEVVPLDFSR